MYIENDSSYRVRTKELTEGQFVILTFEIQNI